MQRKILLLQKNKKWSIQIFSFFNNHIIALEKFLDYKWLQRILYDDELIKPLNSKYESVHHILKEECINRQVVLQL